MKKETQEKILQYFEPYLSFTFAGILLLIAGNWFIQDSQTPSVTIALILSIAISFIGMHSYKKIKQREENKK